MLVLTRKLGEEVVIGDHIRLTVVAIHSNKVRLGFSAPADVLIHRGELCPPGVGFAPPARRPATREGQA